MHFSKYIVATALLLLLHRPASAAEPDRPAAAAASSRILVFSKAGWFRHPETPAINGFLVRLLAESGLTVDVTETPADLSAANLKHYRVLLLNNANHLGEVLSEKERQAVEEWFRAGGGLVSLHAGSVQHKTWPWLIDVTGCDFDSDSEHMRAKLTVDPAAREHPAVRGAEPEFWYSADWHNYTRPVTGLPGVQVLLRIDEASYTPVRKYFADRGGKAMGADHPVAWTRSIEGGRLFYTCLGHDVRSLDTPFGRRHVIEGIRWVMARP